MKHLLYLLFAAFPVLIMAQGTGINFEQGLTWQQIKQKAKKENKYIFVDCYATWCGPCKQMDATIYPNEKVGNAVNSKFISVKVQMDKTNEDNDSVKSWYYDADRFSADYTVNAFPTFLFFSPEGKPLHKSIGAKTETSFIALTNDAINPDKQYYSLLTNYKPGVLDTVEMKGLARAYKRTGMELAEKIVSDYLNRIPAAEKFDEGNLKFISEFTAAPKIKQIAYEYLSSLSKDAFSKKYNISFAVAFCNDKNVQVQDLCINHFKSLNEREFADTSNLKFTAALSALPTVDEMLANFLKRLSPSEFSDIMARKYMKNAVLHPAVQDVIANYLENLKEEEMSKIFNMGLAISCYKNEKIKTIVNRFIGNMKAKDLNNHAVIDFINWFINTSADTGFKLFYDNQVKIDAVMTTIEKGQDKFYIKGYAETIVNRMISNELVNDEITKAKKGSDIASWDATESKIKERIKEKYPKADADQIMLSARIQVYSAYAKKDRKYDHELIKYRIERINKYGPSNGMLGPDGTLNGTAYDIFERSDDTTQLNTAIKWMEGVVKRNPQNEPYLDTYASLLYKVGRVKEALDIEPRAARETYNKMLKGLPIWPVQEKQKPDKY